MLGILKLLFFGSTTFNGRLVQCNLQYMHHDKIRSLFENKIAAKTSFNKQPDGLDWESTCLVSHLSTADCYTVILL